MSIRCVQCQGEVVPGATFCPACGRPVDADGNGLPDALDAMVQAAAKKAVAEERAKESARVERSKGKKRRQLDEFALAENLATPRTWGALALRRARDGFVVAALVLMSVGFPIKMILASFGAGLSGPLLCAVQCPDCRPPGRAFSWNYKGSCQDNKGRMGYAYVCGNPVADVSTLRWTDVRSDPLNSALQPYMVHGGLTYLGDALVAGVIVAALRALFGTGAKLARLDAERAEIERRLRLG